MRAWIDRHRPTLLLIAGFTLAGFLVFGQNLRHDFIPFDDEGLIYQNRAIQSVTPANLATVFTTYDPELYIPLTYVSFQLDYMVAGLHPWVYHLTNLLLHILNALLVVAVVKLLTDDEWIAIGCGALFLLHPINIEAVAWASGRKDTLSTAFFLASLVAYLRYLKTEKAGTYRLSVEMFLLALLSKIMAVTLPVVLLLIDWMKGRPFDRKTLTEKIPYFLLSIAFGIVGLFGKSDVIGVSTPVQKFLMAGKSTAYYVAKLLFPVHRPLILIQKTPIAFTPEFLGGWLIILLLVAAGALAAWRKRRDIAFGIAFFLVTLAPSFLNFIRARTFLIASDRYAYAPSIGFFVAILCIVIPFARKRMTSPGIRRLAIAFAVAVVTLLAALSWEQAAVWQDGITIFTDALTYFPDSAISYVNRGVAYESAGKTELAAKDFEAATHYDPLSTIGWLDLGAMHMKLGKDEQALADFKRALAIEPTYAPTHAALSKLFLDMGRIKDARDAFYNASMLDPDYVIYQGGFTKEDFEKLGVKADGTH